MILMYQRKIKFNRCEKCDYLHKNSRNNSAKVAGLSRHIFRESPEIREAFCWTRERSRSQNQKLFGLTLLVHYRAVGLSFFRKYAFNYTRIRTWIAAAGRSFA